MTFNSLLHFGGAIFCGGLACLGLVRDHRSFVHRIFTFAMVVLALETLFTGLSLQAILPEDVICWQRWRSVATALLPGSWLLFSLTFSRGDWKPTLGRWKWALVATFLVLLALVTIFASDFFGGAPVFDSFHGWFLSLGWSGYIFHVCFLVSVIVIIMLLEKTLQASRGRQRWQVKFLVLGIGAFLAARIYTASQVLLFHGLNLELEVINAGALIVANLFVLISMFRTYFLHMDIYLSQTMLHSSLTLLIVGIYLLAVGVLAKVMNYINWGLSLPLQAFFIFIALVVLAIVLYSARLRLELKKFVSRHLRRPQYDYRKVWSDFTERTATLVEEKALCNAVAKMISEMLNTLSVSIWLLDERGQVLKYGGSTTLSEAQARDLNGFGEGASDLLRLMRDQETIVDLDDDESVGTAEFRQAHESFFQQARIRYCIPLKAGEDLLGLITVDDHVKELSLSFEDLDILKTVADQVAATLLNYKLSERLQNAKEMEAFQTVAALFVHDLKNVASKLSLLLQNMPSHFDNPAFREDALRSMSQSVEKINSMCSRLSLVRNRLEIQPVEADLNHVVTSTLAGLNGIVKASIVEEFHSVPKVLVDPEQIRKVLINLVLNANDAAGDGGKIHVTTGTRDGWVEFTVSDDGCGMSREFMDQCLFRPFRTNKKQGTGIGLFHSKMIVDAHEGQIDVESQEGEGSTFRVILPLRGDRSLK